MEITKWWCIMKNQLLFWQTKTKLLLFFLIQLSVFEHLKHFSLTQFYCTVDKRQTMDFVPCFLPVLLMVTQQQSYRVEFFPQQSDIPEKTPSLTSCEKGHTQWLSNKNVTVIKEPYSMENSLIWGNSWKYLMIKKYN